ncbi:MAG: 30S ribosomal protein S20, partial [Chloroflexota bacterium]
AEEARVETLKAIKAIDRAASKGVFHKNKAARCTSRLMKQLNSM